MNINIGNRVGLILMAASLVGCGGGGGGSDPPIITPTRTLTGVSVSGNNTVTAGQSVQFQATATFSSGAPETVTSSATWTSDNTGVATVNGSGVATGVSAGTTQIRAAHQNMSGSAPLQVNASPTPPPPTNTPPVASFVVTGPSGNNVCRLMVGSGGDFDCTFDGSASTGGSGGAVVQWTWRWDVLADSGGPVTRNVPTFKLSDQCGFFTGGPVTNTSVQMIVKLVVKNAAGVESAELRNSQVTLVHNDQCGF